MPIFKESAALVLVQAVLLGCSNQFLTSYRGERFDPTTDPGIVSLQPANTGLIGSSNFVSGGSLGQPEAIAAARAVGAEFVQWSRGLDSKVAPAGAGTVQASLSPTGPMSSWAPVQPGAMLYRYVARYYKRGVKDAPGVQPMPTESPTAGASDQVIEDGQAATQKSSHR